MKEVHTAMWTRLTSAVALALGWIFARLQDSASLYPSEYQVDTGLEFYVEKDVWSQLTAESYLRGLMS